MSLAIVLMASMALSQASAEVLSSRSTTGTATFYGGNTDGGACSLSGYTLPSGVYGTALSSAFWDTSANCGACVSITGPTGVSITAMVTDECPGGCNGHDLDLYETGFLKLGAASVGILDITWDFVTCPITTPLELKSKEGVSADWFSMQARNANQAVSKLETSSDGGTTWEATTRMDYNYFQNSAGVGTSINVRVTAEDGSVVVVDKVTVSPNTVTAADSQFGDLDTTVKIAAVVGWSSSSSFETPNPATSSAPVTETVIAEPTSNVPVIPTTSVQPTTTEAPVIVDTAVSQIPAVTATPVQVTTSSVAVPTIEEPTLVPLPEVTSSIAVAVPAPAPTSAPTQNTAADWDTMASILCAYNGVVDSVLGAGANKCGTTTSAVVSDPIDKTTSTAIDYPLATDKVWYTNSSGIITVTGSPSAGASYSRGGPNITRPGTPSFTTSSVSTMQTVNAAAANEAGKIIAYVASTLAMAFLL